MSVGAGAGAGAGGGAGGVEERAAERSIIDRLRPSELDVDYKE